MTTLRLYLAEIEGVGVKVGVSHNPKVRVADHARMARKFGRKLGRVWVSGPTPSAEAFEFTLRKDHQTEYTTRSYEECVAEAARLGLSGVEVTISVPPTPVRLGPARRFFAGSASHEERASKPAAVIQDRQPINGERVTVTLPPETVETLRLIATATGETLSRVFRDRIDKGLASLDAGLAQPGGHDVADRFRQLLRAKPDNDVEVAP